MPRPAHPWRRARAGFRPSRAPDIPALWQAVCAYWQLPPRLEQRWWQALSRSTWSRPVSLRQGVLACADGSSQHAVLAPEAYVEILEDLWKEGHLSRSEASTLQDQVLHRAGADGRWKGAV